MGLLLRFWQHLYVMEMPIVPRPGQTVVRPRCQDDLDCLSKPPVAFFLRYTEDLEFRRIEPPSSTPVDPTTGEYIEQRHLFGQAQRVVKRRQRDTRTGCVNAVCGIATCSPIICTDRHTLSDGVRGALPATQHRSPFYP